nr:unnamed protein product [Callosobruchus analis]
MNWLRKRIYDPDLENKYKILKKIVNKDVKLEKRNYYRKLINNSSNSSKTLWRLVNSLSNRNSKSNLINEIEYEGSSYKEPLEIANIFGKYLSAVIKEKIINHFTTLSDSCTTSSRSSSSSMFFSPVIQEDVVNVISSLPNKKCTGPDDIPLSIIKENVDVITPVLTDIINLSVIQGVFPSTLKLASVILIHKKGDPCNVENYRSIALLSIFSKIIEKTISIKIECFLQVNNILADCQYGFRAGLSTEANTIDCIQHIYDMIDVGDYTVAIFFDLSRAFDTVTSKFVSDKLQAMGIRDPINSWLTSYLDNRKVYVKICDAKSEEFELSSGTPQGSVLGPLIFLLFINDLPDHLTVGKPFLYADDTCIIVSASSKDELTSKIDITIKEFLSWCQKNRLLINSGKTILIEFHNKMKKPLEL